MAEPGFAQNEILVMIGPSSSSRGRALLGCLSVPLMYVRPASYAWPVRNPTSGPREKQEQQTAKGSNRALRRHLLAMQKTDRTIQAPILVLFPERQASMAPALRSTDEIFTGELKEIVALRGWPIVSPIGRDASKAASSILLHSRDRDFRKVQPQLVGEDRSQAPTLPVRPPSLDQGALDPIVDRVSANSKVFGRLVQFLMLFGSPFGTIRSPARSALSSMSFVRQRQSHDVGQ